MVKLPGSFDCKTKSSAFPSTAKLSVRNVAAGFGSLPRNQAEQAFSVCRIPKTLSRARRIFWPGFPMTARSSCTRSLGAWHPIRVKLAGLHGFTDGTLTGGVLASGRGSAARRMKLTPCGNATVPERQDINRRATARMLRGAEYIFSPARTCNSAQTVLGGTLPDGRQPEAAQGTVEPRSGTTVKDESRRAKPPQTFLKCFWSGARSSEFRSGGLSPA